MNCISMSVLCLAGCIMHFDYFMNFSPIHTIDGVSIDLWDLFCGGEREMHA